MNEDAKITDHLFTNDDADPTECLVCGYGENLHDDDNYDPTPEHFVYDGPRDSIEFQAERFAMGE